jgi:hypothetical protein
MSLEHELLRLYERAQDAPWPGERDAYGRFLRRKARRGRTMAAAVAIALLLVVGVVGVAPRILPKQDDIRPITPRGTVVQVPDAGFQLVVPRNWTVSRRLTRRASRSAGTAPPSVVGMILSPRSARLAGATITVTSGSRAPTLHGGAVGPMAAPMSCASPLARQVPASSPSNGPPTAEIPASRAVLNDLGHEWY